jgi:CHAT domain-containing protein
VAAVRGSIGAETPSRDGAVEHPVTRASRNASSDPRPLLRRLHHVLIEPVSDLLPSDRDRLITIVPHRPLFLVSFAALVDEAAAIGGLYPPRHVTTLIGSRARERTVRELAVKHAVIHLATHAVVFDDDPMGSYLALAPEFRARLRTSRRLPLHRARRRDNSVPGSCWCGDVLSKMGL